MMALYLGHPLEYLLKVHFRSLAMLSPTLAKKATHLWSMQLHLQASIRCQCSLMRQLPCSSLPPKWYENPAFQRQMQSISHENTNRTMKCYILLRHAPQVVIISILMAGFLLVLSLCQNLWIISWVYSQLLLQSATSRTVILHKWKRGSKDLHYLWYQMHSALLMTIIPKKLLAFLP